MSLKLIPLKNDVIIKKIAASKTSQGGIILPDSVVDSQSEGLVIAVGPEEKIILIGDHVMFDPEAALRRILVGGEDYLVLKQEEIFCVIYNVPDNEV
jgi:co-chaperonin GroES (HSP10)